MRCCVPFCKTTAEVVAESDEIAFHGFPREEHLRDAWLRALGKQDTPLSDDAMVCSQHFLRDDIYETASGSRQIRTGAIPSTVLVCMICLDTSSKLIPMSKYKLGKAYEQLVGHPVCGQGKLTQTLCVQCAQRLVNFNAFREKSLRARALLLELLDRHEVITIRHVKMISRAKHQLQSDIVSALSEPDHCDVYITHCDADGRTGVDATATVATATATVATDEAVAVKQEVEHCEEANTECHDGQQDDYKDSTTVAHWLAAGNTPAAAEAQAPVKHERDSSEPTSAHFYKSEWEDCNPALVAPLVLATNHGNEEHPSDTNDEFSKDEKSQVTALKPKASSAKTSASINTRTTRRNDVLKSNPKPQDVFGTQSGNRTVQIQYICEVCQKIFQRKSSLAVHLRTHTGSCELREGKLTQHSTLSSYKRTHTGEKRFACHLCDYKTAHKSTLEVHMRTHTGEKPFACELCDYKCTVKGNLMKHMTTHTREKCFACKLCNYKCVSEIYLARHMSIHGGEKRFACGLCDFKCRENGGLVKHLRTHTGEKPYACELCDFKCRVKSSLVSHMIIHTGEKPFVCELCDYKGSRSISLVRHLRTHTGEKPYACKLCDYKSAKKCQLVKHMRTHTGE